MAVEVVLNTPLAEALASVIQPKLVEVGWSSGGTDDSALSEYIILMLVNGKTQDQIAAELSGDLLNLGPDDPGATDFSKWLFEQVEMIHATLNGGSAQRQGSAPGAGDGDAMGDEAHRLQGMDRMARDDTGNAQDSVMSESGNSGPQGNIPTGPRSMRDNNGGIRRNNRLMGQLTKAMDRSSDSVLHRVRSDQGNARINSHSREPPKGPRNAQNRIGKQPVGRNIGQMQNMGPGGPMLPMNPQQIQLLNQMFQEQQQMLAMMSPDQQQQMFMASGAMMMPMMNPQFGVPPMQHQQPGKSLFERVEVPVQRQNGSFNKRNQPRHNEGPRNHQDANMEMTDAHEVPTSHGNASSSDNAMEGVEKKEFLDAVCKFNHLCTKKDCPYGHQSPVAPPGTHVDLTDNCPYGAACKNRKCVARHPSPSQKLIHQAEQECKFFPNCTNPNCPFKHPTMPLCRNGADCTREGCKFTHVKTMCKFNPCLNPACAFKHAEGQKRGGFEDKVWVAGGEPKEHVSERKFVDDGGEEELIVPGSSQAESTASLQLTVT